MKEYDNQIPPEKMVLVLKTESFVIAVIYIGLGIACFIFFYKPSHYSLSIKTSDHASREIDVGLFEGERS